MSTYLFLVQRTSVVRYRASASDAKECLIAIPAVESSRSQQERTGGAVGVGLLFHHNLPSIINGTRPSENKSSRPRDQIVQVCNFAVFPNNATSLTCGVERRADHLAIPVHSDRQTPTSHPDEAAWKHAKVTHHAILP